MTKSQKSDNLTRKGRGAKKTQMDIHFFKSAPNFFAAELNFCFKFKEKTKLEAMETTEKILIGDKELKTFNFVDFNRNR